MVELRVTTVLFVSGGDNGPAIAVSPISVARPIICMVRTGGGSFHHDVEREDWVRWPALQIVPPTPPIISPAPRNRDQIWDETAVERLSDGSGLMLRGEVAGLQSLPPPNVVTPSLVSGRVHAALSVIAATFITCHDLRIEVALTDDWPSHPVVIRWLETAYQHAVPPMVGVILNDYLSTQAVMLDGPVTIVPRVPLSLSMMVA